MRTFVLIGILASTPAFAATYSPTDAGKHIGESATVEGVANVYVSSGGTIFIDLGGSGRSAPFTGVIFKDKASAIPNVNSYSGKTVDLSGTIKEYRRKPEIVIEGPGQIAVR